MLKCSFKFCEESAFLVGLFQNILEQLMYLGNFLEILGNYKF